MRHYYSVRKWIGSYIYKKICLTSKKLKSEKLTNSAIYLFRIFFCLFTATTSNSDIGLRSMGQRGCSI